MLKTISKKLRMKKPLILYYLRKLAKAKMLLVTIKKDPDRNKDTKYYGVKPFLIHVGTKRGQLIV